MLFLLKFHYKNNYKNNKMSLFPVTVNTILKYYFTKKRDIINVNQNFFNIEALGK